MLIPSDTTNDVPEFSVRRYRPDEDRAEVERLLKDGLMPGRVEYEPRILDQIKSKLGSEREIFLVAETAGGGRLIGMLAVVEADPDIGHLHWFRVDRSRSPWPAPPPPTPAKSACSSSPPTRRRGWTKPSPPITTSSASSSPARATSTACTCWSST